MARTALDLREARGVITLAQEDRFRLQMADGRSALFVLGQALGHSLERLETLAGSGDEVLVRYRGDLDAGPVAEDVTHAG